LAGLPVQELAARLTSVLERLATASEVNARLRAVVVSKDTLLSQLQARHEAELALRDRQIRELADRIAQLERQAGRDSSNSSKPPGSDSAFKRGKRGKDRSLRAKSGLTPGKQPGTGSATLRLVDDPDETFYCPPPVCGCCGKDLADAPVTGQQRRQVTEIAPPAPPRVTEYRVQAKECGICGTTTVGVPPAFARARASYGPDTHAQACNLVAGHFLPVGRAVAVLRQAGGIIVSTGWMAGVRGKAAARLEPFMDHVRLLLRQAGVLHADETPAHAGGRLEYVHVVCTKYLTHLHTGGRSAADIDAGKVLPGYTGTIMRDGYAGYGHLITALHAWCGAHTLRDLKGVYDFDAKQVWATSMATLLVQINDAARAARAGGASALPSAELDAFRARYHELIAEGQRYNRYRRHQAATDAKRLLRRFTQHEDMILRFMTDLTLEFTNNVAEGDARPVKVQQRASGGCWRTLQGLADFAIVQSYLSTAGKWWVSPRNLEAPLKREALQWPRRDASLIKSSGLGRSGSYGRPGSRSLRWPGIWGSTRALWGTGSRPIGGPGSVRAVTAV
jgi:transposase